MLRVALLTLGLLLVPWRALAQSAEGHVEFAPAEMAARGHFLMAQEHLHAGRFAAAADEMRLAYELSPRPPLLFNVYVAERDAGNLEGAADALRQYIELAPDDPNITLHRSRLQSLDAQIAARQAASTPSGVGPAPSEPITVAPTASPTPPTEPAVVPVSSSSPSSGDGGPSIGAWILLGTGAALAVGGAITGALTLATAGELDSHCPSSAGHVCDPGYDYASTASTGEALSIVTDVLFGAAIVSVGIGVVVLLTTDGGTSPERAFREPVIRF